MRLSHGIVSLVGSRRILAGPVYRTSRGAPALGRDMVSAPRHATDPFACAADKTHGEAVRLYRRQDGGATWMQVDHAVTVRTTLMAVAVAVACR
jgi:hypothetical protein